MKCGINLNNISISNVIQMKDLEGIIKESHHLLSHVLNTQLMWIQRLANSTMEKTKFNHLKKPFAQLL